MSPVLVRISLRAIVLLSAFLIAIAIPSIVRHRKASNVEKLCVEMPASNSLEPPCTRADLSLLPTLSYCDLMAAPLAYENKLVRVRLDYLSMGIGMLRRDDICTKGSTDFHLEIVAGAEDSATQGLMNAWNAELLPRGSVFIVVGRFRKEPTQTKDDSQKYQLELLRIDSVVCD